MSIRKKANYIIGTRTDSDVIFIRNNVDMIKIDNDMIKIQNKPLTGLANNKPITDMTEIINLYTLNENNNEFDNLYLNLNINGNKMKGSLLLVSDILTNDQLITKSYIDNIYTFTRQSNKRLGPVIVMQDNLISNKVNKYIVTKKYIDEIDIKLVADLRSVTANYLAISGGVMNGELILSDDISSNNKQAITYEKAEEYKNRLKCVKLIGDEISGYIYSNNTSLELNSVITKDYVDSNLSSLIRYGFTLDYITNIVNNVKYLHISGDIFSGRLILADCCPTSNTIIFKRYVDEFINNKNSLYSTESALMNKLNNYYKLSTETNETNETNKTNIINGKILIHNVNPLSDNEVISYSYLQSEVNKLVKLPISGGELTEPLLLSYDNFTNQNQAVSISYINNSVGNNVRLTGDIMTGYIALFNNATDNLNPVTKQDMNKYLPTGGGTISGILNLSSEGNNPNNNLQIISKSYVNNNLNNLLLKSGSEINGTLLLYNSPVNNNDPITLKYLNDSLINKVSNNSIIRGPLTINSVAYDKSIVNKEYLDSEINKALLIGGGSILTGCIVLNRDPELPLHAITKQYLDDQLSNKISLSNGRINGRLTVVPDNSIKSILYKEIITNSLNNLVSKNGTIMNGYITLNSDPTLPLHPITKQYLENVNNKILLSGGILTNNISSPNSVLSKHLINKGSLENIHNQYCNLSGNNTASTIKLGSITNYDVCISRNNITRIYIKESSIMFSDYLSLNNILNNSILSIKQINNNYGINISTANSTSVNIGVDHEGSFKLASLKIKNNQLEVSASEDNNSLVNKLYVDSKRFNSEIGYFKENILINNSSPDITIEFSSINTNLGDPYMWYANSSTNEWVIISLPNAINIWQICISNYSDIRNNVWMHFLLDGKKDNSNWERLHTNYIALSNETRYISINSNNSYDKIRFTGVTGLPLYQGLSYIQLYQSY